VEAQANTVNQSAFPSAVVHGNGGLYLSSAGLESLDLGCGPLREIIFSMCPGRIWLRFGIQGSSFELRLPAKTIDSQKGDDAYFGTNPGSYTSAAATDVASLKAPLTRSSVASMRAGSMLPSGLPGIWASSATASVSFLAIVGST
jgi:hypothetical protein